MQGSPLPRKVLDEINACRSNPARYSSKLQSQIRYFNGMIFQKPGADAIQTQEGADAVREAIAVLKSARPLPTLFWVQEISRACNDHIKDIGPKGIMGHTGSNGSDPGSRMQKYGTWDTTLGQCIDYSNTQAQDIVFGLLVDDGVPARLHRGNLLQSQFKVAGVGFGNHKDMDFITVIDFAGGFTPKGQIQSTQVDDQRKAAQTNRKANQARKKHQQEQKKQAEVKRTVQADQRRKQIDNSSMNLTSDEIDDCKEAFDIFDTDGSGTIDPRQIEAAIRALSHDRSSTMFRLLAGVEELGAQIDFDSFLAHVSSRLGNRNSREGVQKILDLYDHDGTGTINIDNLVRVAKELGESMSEDDLRITLDNCSGGKTEVTLDDLYMVLTRKL